MSQLTVSVIIPSKDRLAGIERILNNLSTQDYPSALIEIILIDDGSTSPYIFSQNNLQIIRHQESHGAQQSRNEGLQIATGDIAFIMDDDIELIGNSFISKAVAVYENQPQVAALFSKKIDVIEKNGQILHHEFSTSKLTFYSGELLNKIMPSGPYTWGHGPFLSARRDIILKIGGYDGIYGLNGGHSFREESDVYARIVAAGHLVWYLSEIEIHHHVIATGGHGSDIGKRLFWIAHNHMIFIKRHIPLWQLKGIGFIFDILRYSWHQGKFIHMPSMIRGYFAGWANALRDQGPGKNKWLTNH